MNKITRYLIIAAYVSMMTLFAMLFYSYNNMIVGVILEVILIISILPSWYLVNFKSDFENDNAYQSFPYHLITYVCNILISFGFYFFGNVGYEVVI
jgi:hypothetical protein